MIGIHIDSTPNDLIKSAIDAFQSGAKIIQLFVNNSIKDKSIYDNLNKFLIKHKMKCFVHGSYTINLAQNWDNYSWWIQQFIDEIKLASKLNAEAIVIHMGKQLNLSKEEAINNMYTSLMHIYNETKDYKIKILLETPTGQGSEIGYRLEDLTLVYRKFSKHKKNDVSQSFGICLDTCHIFSAGYNIKNKESRDIFFDSFNELIGIKHIKLVHLNDSKVPCNSRVDRHENIGKGYIGEKTLRKFAKSFKKINVPIIIETSYPEIYNDLDIIIKS